VYCAHPLPHFERTPTAPWLPDILKGPHVTPSSSARTIQVIGGVIFVIGAILLGVGTTSIGLFLFYGVLAIAGLVVFFVGQKKYVKSIRK
jgi:hypothetical protein